MATAAASAGYYSAMIKNPIVRSVIGAAVLLGCCGVQAAFAQSWAQFQNPKPNPLPMIARSVIPEVEGRMGRLAMDQKSGRLYVAALRDGSLRVLDHTLMKIAQVVPNLPEPQGVLMLEDQRRLLVSCGDGSVRVFKLADDGAATEERKVFFGGEADAIRYDERNKRAWVGHGKFVTSFDPATGEKAKTIDMPGMTDGLAVEQRGTRVFVNVGSEGKILVIDKDKNAIDATWTLKDAKGNNPIDLDEDNGRLFIASRNPGRLIVLDSADGKEITRLPIGEDADDLWYDRVGTRIYVSCGGGAGEVSIAKQDSKDTYTMWAREATTAGSRTSVLIPQKRRYIVIAPKSGDTPCFVFIYVIAP